VPIAVCKNGKSINQSRVHLNNYKLSIANVTTKDEGMYTCMIINDRTMLGDFAERIVERGDNSSTGCLSCLNSFLDCCCDLLPLLESYS